MRARGRVVSLAACQVDLGARRPVGGEERLLHRGDASATGHAFDSDLDHRGSRLLVPARKDAPDTVATAERFA
jgi:hypothetical protein